MSKRAVHIVGNWKMNQNKNDVLNFFNQLQEIGLNADHQYWIAPQFIHLPLALELAKGQVKIGSQDCSNQNHGAFTGDTSSESLKDLGAHFTLVGHSERRSIQKESHQLLNQKTFKAIENGLKVIFCVGESLEEREAGKTLDVVKEQLQEGLKGLDKHSEVIIAYEPVWAIGTGKTASPEQAEEVHAMIRKFAADTLGFNAEEVIILYGGSVKPANVEQLLACENIDGGLVGGASLKAESFANLK